MTLAHPTTMTDDNRSAAPAAGPPPGSRPPGSGRRRPRRLPRVTGTGMVAAATYAVCGLLVLPPLFTLVRTSLTVRGHEGWTLDNYRALLVGDRFGEPLLNSLVFAGGTSLVALILGTALAWLVERTDARFATVAQISAFISLAVPYVVRSIGWVLLLGPEQGFLTTAGRSLMGWAESPFQLFSMTGMVLVNGLSWTPAVFLLLSIPLRSMDPALEEASAMSGAGGRTTFRRVTLPLVRPAALSVVLLTFVQSLEAFETPAIIGLPGRVPVLTTEIYQSLKLSVLPDYGRASAYATVLIVLVAGAIAAYVRMLRRAARFQTVGGRAYRPHRQALGRWRPLGSTAVLALPALVALPSLALLWASWLPVYGTPSLDALGSLTIDNYAAVVREPALRRAMLNTLIVGASAATAAVVICAAAAWVVLRTTLRGRTGLEYLTSIPMVIPSIVLGVALMQFYLSVPLAVYGTLSILVIANLTRQLPFAARYANAGFLQIHADLEESVLMSGGGRLRAFVRVLLPLALPALAAAWVWVFLQSVSELALAVLLSSPDSRLLSNTIFDLYQYGQMPRLGAISVVMTTVAVGLSLVLYRAARRWGVAL